ncbi:MAG: 3-phosphoshikimate 1-carboxyvinyltransferase [Thaumarchaeota archaeon]|nr:3-phosphoshikimate 1-carboxyvinyltransferase [Nitrososphaerota archaeon]
MSGRVRLSSTGELGGKVQVPPSKSYTHRAFVMASLASGTSRISNPLVSRDTLATLRACQEMGASLRESQSEVEVIGSEPKTPGDVVNVENSGSTLRFMTSIFSLPAGGCTVLTGDSSIRRRPMQPLLDALSQLGVKAWSAPGNGCAPIIVSAGGMRGGRAEIRGDVSSQFVSSVLMSAPLASSDSSLAVTDAVSRPYIDATLLLSELFGVSIHRKAYSNFDIPGGQQYRASGFRVPADFSSASFIMAAVAMAGGSVELSGLTQTFPQGDSKILDILVEMGVKVIRHEGSVLVEADGRDLRAREFDLTDTPDLLPVVAALAMKCDGPLQVSGVAHARFKETDRIRVLAEELGKTGAIIEERSDGMRISRPDGFVGAALDARGDHRMFMAFALASLVSQGSISVSGEESLDVSYPAFLCDMETIGAAVARE